MAEQRLHWGKNKQKPANLEFYSEQKYIQSEAETCYMWNRKKLKEFITSRPGTRDIKESSLGMKEIRTDGNTDLYKKKKMKSTRNGK